MKKLILLLPFLFTNAVAKECISYSVMDTYDAKSSTVVTIRTLGTTDSYDMTVALCLKLMDSENIDFDSASHFEVCESDYLLVLDEYSGNVLERCRVVGIKKN